MSFFAHCNTFSRQRIHEAYPHSVDLHTSDGKAHREKNSRIKQIRTPHAGVLFCVLQHIQQAAHSWGLVPTLTTCILPNKTDKDTSRKCPFLRTETLSADSAFMGLIPTLPNCILPNKTDKGISHRCPFLCTVTHYCKTA
ncbi:hypothetical protein [Ruminococcus albus]|uniref:Uncharacterized protein n=1 Tax=Ruminococcus albus 8 TaxID=246199 RepID=E9SCH3_RUMAL|nr:hypothetical protein [Ruminococcus albus]EGC03060.1 hypothetical protein CUS_5886 [Ruminococcus albus 8]MCC3352330.1 hypothetical protein [Ruminococcus albus 8]